MRKADKKTHDVHFHNINGQKISGVNMPMNADADATHSLTWYFISWHNKIGKWDFKKKIRYAKEISEISQAVPIHLIGRHNDDAEVSAVLSSAKIKLFKYANNKFIMLDESGNVLQEVTSMNLYALLVYLVDSLSKGLEDHPGFDFIKLSKAIIVRDSNAK